MGSEGVKWIVQGGRSCQAGWGHFQVAMTLLSLAPCYLSTRSCLGNSYHEADSIPIETTPFWLV